MHISQTDPGGNVLSVLFNLLIAVSALSAIRAHAKNSPPKILLRFFTVLSNILCAAACLAVAAVRLSGGTCEAVFLLKYVGTAAVTVTLLTVLFFLGPFVVPYKVLLSGPDLWLHLICPVLAIVSFLAWDRPELSFPHAFLCVVPVLLYACLYLYKVVFAPEGKRWEDFYGFNRSNRWPLSFMAMMAASFLIGAALFLIGRRG